MKIIKIFLASSDELSRERLVLTDLEVMLNNRLLKKGIFLSIELWEHINSSMNKRHKQEEYNDVLKECDICIAMFWTKFGEYTKEEFEVAYKSMQNGRNPKKLYVFFKDSQMCDENLKKFKENISKKYNLSGVLFSNREELCCNFLVVINKYMEAIDFEPIMIPTNNQCVVDGVVMSNISYNKTV